MRTTTQILKNVYTAAQCTDANDARIALENIYENATAEEQALAGVLRRVIALRKVLRKHDPEAFMDFQDLMNKEAAAKATQSEEPAVEQAPAASTPEPEYVKIAVAAPHPLDKYNGMVVKVAARQDGMIAVLPEVWVGGYWLTPLQYDPAPVQRYASFPTPAIIQSDNAETAYFHLLGPEDKAAILGGIYGTGALYEATMARVTRILSRWRSAIGDVWATDARKPHSFKAVYYRIK